MSESAGSLPPAAKRPLPPTDLRAVDAVLIRVVPAGNLPVAEFLLGVRADLLQLRDAVNRVDCKTEPVGLVVNGKFHGRVDIAFLFVPAHMQVVVIGAAIGQAVNQPGIAVEVEDYRLVGRK